MIVKFNRRTTMRIYLPLIVALATLIGGNFAKVSAQTRQNIKLVLKITIDGLRADLINRYQNGFGQGGFRFLMENGTHYTNAQYQHANTETIVGHATLATGTFPSQHGMVGNVWFDREAGELAYNIEVEQAVADALTDFDGIALAVATSRLSEKQTNPLLEQVRNNHHISRSGNIYLIQEPYWFLFDKGPIAAMHGSPWRYDTHVPIIFMGSGLQPQTVHRRVHPVDVAPIIAASLGMTPPGSAQGTPLEEVFH